MQSIRVALAVGILFGMLLTGCASVQPKPPALSSGEPAAGQGWWTVRFKMNWPKDTEPSWHIDLLLAHRVVGPVLEEHRKEIALWRFHRRAVPDSAGHQFSFIFYSTPATANEIYAAIRSDATLRELIAKGFIIENSYDDTAGPLKPAIEATSDQHWSMDVQKSWPYYIMGVCEMWLHLIDGTVQATGKKACSLNDTLELYKQANATVTRIWQDEGDHAFLHHMNAIFGYAPIIVIEQRPMTF